MISFSNLGYYLLYWIIFGIIHTLLASNTLKSKIPMNVKNYRILYNILVTANLLVVLLFVPSITTIILKFYTLAILPKIGFLLLSATGGLISLWGLTDWNIPGFLGIEHDNNQLKTTNSFAFARHPVYTGIIITLISVLIIEVSAASLSWLIGVAGYFILGSYSEENKLANHYGEEYIVYRNKVGRFFPLTVTNWRYLKSNFIQH